MWSNYCAPFISCKALALSWVLHISSAGGIIIQNCRNYGMHIMHPWSWFLSASTIHIPYSGKFSRGPIFAEGQTSSISRSNFRGWPFQNCSAHNTWLTPPFTACARRLKNSGVGVLPGSYATFLQNELLSIKAHHCSHSILSSVFSYLKSGENFS